MPHGSFGPRAQRVYAALRDRIARISELTGVDLESAEGRGLAWLAWLARVSA